MEAVKIGTILSVTGNESNGDIQIIGIDGVARDVSAGDIIYEGESVVSTQPNASVEVKYDALGDVSVYEGVFDVLVDSSVFAEADELENILDADTNIDQNNIETAAGEESAAALKP